ncbi:uncharacterized protein LOC129595296 [Paramacrobiotus metropolitanus]|uniref:uncharacterized protein LOC129595296 n=1 Tax=Paramacrobiotus metropolitanus TaxID=2943436 RepID=UPI002446276F|nr:uncharacterized protein LOC129595296 [Paramacrobiotus metropolitanus]
MLRLMHYANAVDVLGDDGLKRYGRVVDVADDGLFVDLLYPNRRREHVPFDRLFLPIVASRAQALPNTHPEFSKFPVEVLVPETPVGPLVWLPAEAVSLGRCESVDAFAGAIIHWRRKDDGLRCTDIVPCQRIRWPLRRALELDRHIQPGTFFKGTVPLGNAFPVVSSDEAEDLIRRLNDPALRNVSCPCTVDVVELVNGRLGYIYPLETREIVGMSDPRYGRALASFANFQAELLRMSTLSEEVNEETALPMKVWQEVFSQVGTVTQTQLRAVCKAWNRLMDTPALRGRLRIGDFVDSNVDGGNFLRMASVFKRLQPGTQDVVVHSCYRRGPSALNTSDLLMLCDMIRYVARHRSGIRLRRVHWNRFTVELQMDGTGNLPDSGECVLHPSVPAATEERTTFRYQLEEFIAACGRLPCDAVHMTSCVLRVLCGWFYREYGERKNRMVRVGISIPSVRLPTGRNLRCALWDALDAALPVANEQEIRKLLFRAELENSFDLKKVIALVLCALQSADPRSSAHYRGKKWCVDGLEDLRLAHLSRISRQFLVQLQRDTDASYFG